VFQQRSITSAGGAQRPLPEADVAVQNMDLPMDLSRSSAELGYEPKYDMTAAVRDYVEWYRARKP